MASLGIRAFAEALYVFIDAFLAACSGSPWLESGSLAASTPGGTPGEPKSPSDPEAPAYSGERPGSGRPLEPELASGLRAGKKTYAAALSPARFKTVERRAGGYELSLRLLRVRTAEIFSATRANLVPALGL